METSPRRAPIDLQKHAEADGKLSVGLASDGRPDDQIRQERKMEAVGRLAGGVAHDFNNILTVIGGFCEVVLEQLQSGDTLFHDVMEIKKASDRGASLTRQLLAFSRRRVRQPHISDLNRTIRDMQRMLQRLVGEEIQLRLALSDALGHIEIDASEIEQVLLNLVVNARDAMPRGGLLLIETANAPGMSSAGGPEPHAGDSVELSVTDAGVGIPADVQAQLFEPFFTTKDEGCGSGLGLATIGDIVGQAGGSIQVDSQLGKGTTFKISFPRACQPLTQHIPERGAPIESRGRETILLVDDELAVRALIERILARAGYCVISACDGLEAIDVIRARTIPIDLLLADVVLPKASGYQVAEEVVRYFPRAKVLYISGYDDDAIRSHGIERAVDALLHKPFSPHVLSRAIREMLDGGSDAGRANSCSTQNLRSTQDLRSTQGDQGAGTAGVIGTSVAPADTRRAGGNPAANVTSDAA